MKLTRKIINQHAISTMMLTQRQCDVKMTTQSSQRSYDRDDEVVASQRKNSMMCLVVWARRNNLNVLISMFYVHVWDHVFVGGGECRDCIPDHLECEECSKEHGIIMGLDMRACL